MDSSPAAHEASAASNAARADAIANAKAKATHYAKLLGVRLSTVTTLDETTAPSPYPIMMATAKADSGVTQVDAYGDRVVLEVTGAVTEVMRLAVELGVTAVKSEEPSLDEIFVSLIDGGKK